MSRQGLPLAVDAGAGRARGLRPAGVRRGRMMEEDDDDEDDFVVEARNDDEVRCRRPCRGRRRSARI